MGSSKIKAVLFDKDGTLLKYNETWVPINMKAARLAARGDEMIALHLLVSTGFDPESGAVQAGSLLGAGNTEEIAEIWSQNGARFLKTELISMLDSEFSKAMQNAVPVNGLVQIINQLHHRGYQLGVASSDSENAIRVFLQQMGLATRFSFVSGYDSGFGHKPDTGMFDAFCRTIKLGPEQVAMIGDNPQDLQMARTGKAGMSIGVLSGNGTHADLSPLSDMVLNDISQLGNVFSSSWH